MNNLWRHKDGGIYKVVAYINLEPTYGIPEDLEEDYRNLVVYTEQDKPKTYVRTVSHFNNSFSPIKTDNFASF